MYVLDLGDTYSALDCLCSVYEFCSRSNQYQCRLGRECHLLVLKCLLQLQALKQYIQLLHLWWAGPDLVVGGYHRAARRSGTQMSWLSVTCAMDRAPIRILSGERSSQYIIICVLDLDVWNGWCFCTFKKVRSHRQFYFCSFVGVTEQTWLKHVSFPNLWLKWPDLSHKKDVPLQPYHKQSDSLKTKKITKNMYQFNNTFTLIYTYTCSASLILNCLSGVMNVWSVSTSLVWIPL